MPTADRDRLRTHLEALTGERNPFTSPEKLAQTGSYIEAHFEALGLGPTREEVPFEGRVFHNLLAEQPGREPGRGVLIVGAHYDSVENTPGADDNASAVAALLEAASLLKDAVLPVPVLFAGFTLEEYGFVGSRLMMERLGRERRAVFGMISLEMLGYRDRDKGSQAYPPYVDAGRYPDRGDFIAVVGNEVSSALTARLAEALHARVPALPVEQLVVPGRGEGFREVQLSDHAPFWEAGYKAVMLTDTAFFRNPHYHQPTDTLATLDVDFIRDITTGLAAYLGDPGA